MKLYAHASPTGELRSNGGAALLYYDRHVADEVMRRELDEDKWATIEVHVYSVLHPMTLDLPSFVKRRNGR